MGIHLCLWGIGYRSPLLEFRCAPVRCSTHVISHRSVNVAATRVPSGPKTWTTTHGCRLWADRRDEVQRPRYSVVSPCHVWGHTVHNLRAGTGWGMQPTTMVRYVQRLDFHTARLQAHLWPCFGSAGPQPGVKRQLVLSEPWCKGCRVGMVTAAEDCTMDDFAIRSP